MDKEAVNSASRARKRIGLSTWLGAVVLFFFLAATVILHWKIDIGQYFTGENIGTTITITRDWAARFGIWGPVLLVLAGAFALLIMTPGFIIIYISVIVFGYVTGYITSTLAMLVGTTLIYFSGQALGRPFVQELFGAKLARLEERFLRRELMNVVYFRLVFFLSPGMNWLLCVSGVRYRNLLLGTLMGTAHHIILNVWFGGLAVELIQSGRSLNPMKTPQVLIPVGIGLAIFVVVRIVDTVHRRRRASESS
jgi:uncharacterized membrane protein YdjX (TVP38/TMEM64 family)